MVSLNITILIELGLFLLFLWGTAVFIVRPVLRSLDDRKQSIEQDNAESETANEQAQNLETQHAEKLTEMRVASEGRYRDARRETLEGHLKAVSDAHQWADNAVAEAREKALAEADTQRAALQQAVPEMADRIADRLRAGGPSA